jgi:hypothetical protein
MMHQVKLTDRLLHGREHDAGNHPECAVGLRISHSLSASSVPPPAAAFARDVIVRTAPEGRERAKNLLQSAGRLADWALPLGLEAAPEVLLHPSVTERFTRTAPGLSGVARRTLRTNPRFIGRRVVPHLYPADLPLPRERAEQP